MSHGLKTILHSSRAVLALNGGLMIILGGAFWILPEFFTFAMFPHILGNETATTVAVALRKIMGAGCIFIGVVLFSCQASSKYTAQRLLFLLRRVFCSCLGLCCTQGYLNRQASLYSCLSFSVPCHYYHFLLPPDATKNNTRQVSYYRNKFEVICWRPIKSSEGQLH